MSIVLKPGEVTLAQWRAIYRGDSASLDESSSAQIAQSAAAVQRILRRDEPVYGINTGFGRLAQVRIEHEDLAVLQRNIVLSHCAGVGEPLPVAIGRLMIALKLASLAQGASGVRLETTALLGAMLTGGITPVIPSQGSVGASGDLAPLAHMAAALIGVGDVLYRGERLPATNALALAGAPACDTRAEGRSRASQWHAVLYGVRAGGSLRSRDAVPERARYRSARDGSGERLRYAVRSAHSRTAPTSRADRDGRGACAR